MKLLNCPFQLRKSYPLLIAPIPVSAMPAALRDLQYVDFTNNICQADYNSDINEILNILKHDQAYYEQHKVLLARALKWRLENYKPSFLLRGHNLDNAQTWLRLNEQRKQHPPLALHQELIAASVAAKGQLNTEVFISYSRKDSDFARQLNRDLQKAGKTTWFDQESISTGVDFEKEIFKGIEGSDNFVFVISPDAVVSEYCEREVNYAAAQSKRFISVLHRETDPATLPEVLRVINWIDFKDTAFDKSFAQLVKTIELDREHARQHTVLQQRASEWVENNRSEETLLNIMACNHAEKWRDTAKVQTKKPPVTPLQEDFIQESREAIRAAHRMRNIAFAVVTVSFVVSVFFGIFAWIQKQEAEKSEIQALSVSSDAFFQSNRTFDALLTGLEAAIKFQQAGIKEPTLKTQVFSTLQNALYWVSEFNTLIHKGLVVDVSFASDGHIASITRDGTLYLWQQNGQLLCQKPTKQQQRPEGRRVSFGSDGKMVAIASKDKKVTLWGSDCEPISIKNQEGLDTAGDSVIFSPQGQLLVTNNLIVTDDEDDNPIKLWKSDGSFIKQLPHKGQVYEVSFASDRNKLALAGGNTVTLWDWQSEVNKVWQTDKEVTWSVSFSDLDEQPLIITADRNNTVKLWKQDSTTPLNTWKNRGSDVRFKPQDKTTFASINNDKVKIWKIDDTLDSIPLKTLFGHNDMVNKINFSPNGQILASASADKTVKLWKQNGFTQVLHGHSKEAYEVYFNPSGQWLITTGYDNMIKLWKKDGTLLATYSTKKVPNNLHFLDNNTFLFNVNSTMKILRWNDKELFSVVNEENANVNNRFDLRQSQINISKNKLIALASKDGIKLWQWANNKLHKLDLEKGDEKVSILAFNSKGNILAAANEKNHSIILWNTEVRKYLTTLVKHDSEISDLRFSPDNQILASAGANNSVILWQQSENGHWQFLTSLEGHKTFVRSIDFSSDGRMIASVDDQGGICFWKRANNSYWKKRCEENAHRTGVTKVLFSSKAGDIWVSASSDKTIKLWYQDGTLLTTLFGHTDGIMSINFSPDGRILASSSRDKTVILWDLEPIRTGAIKKLIARSCQWMQNYLISHPDTDFPSIKETCMLTRH